MISYIHQKTFLCLAILLSIVGEAKAQYLSQIGIKDSVYSEILNETREIYVQFPEGFDPASDKKYPVIYILDGENLLPALSITQGFYSGGFVPDMILIGISNHQNRTRDLTPSKVEPSWEPNGGADTFLKFIENELIPYIESKYPASNFRTLIGHSYGGLFTINTLLHKPDIFANYLAIDPSLDWDDQLMLREAKEIVSKEKFKGKSLFISLSGQLHMQNPEMTLENVVQDDSEFTLFARSNIAFSEFIRSNAGIGLDFDWEFYPKDLHGTVPLPSLRDGLMSLFEWFQMEKVELFNIPETTAEELLELMNYRAKKLEDHLGYSEPPLPEDLINMSGYMSMDMGQMEKAKMFFEQGIRYFPKSANMYDSMADYFESNNELDVALGYVKKAYSISGSDYHKNRMEELMQKLN
ncbi:alpha/beta hydrolase-fold protein [Algoriphagus machipongonensis]|uniref:Esterase n=1 Tax=Algoriphagus machipongonensis TaxID=388413 RepID=A3HZV9_9BACT|nr:alpha/beta hydrolase-fold protein [Algoriphagus machipongonensis]EAZ80795.1 putative esterase [Algoriphagus machipongonensis]